MPYLPLELWQHTFSYLDVETNRSLLAGICSLSRMHYAAARPTLYSIIETRHLQHASLHDRLSGKHGIEFGNLVKEVRMKHILHMFAHDERLGIRSVNSDIAYERGGSGLQEMLQSLKHCPNISTATLAFDSHEDLDDLDPLDSSRIPRPLTPELLALPFIPALRTLTVSWFSSANASYILAAFGQLIVAAQQLKSLDAIRIIHLEELLQPLMQQVATSTASICQLEKLSAEVDLETNDYEEASIIRNNLITSLRKLPSISCLDLRFANSYHNDSSAFYYNVRNIDIMQPCDNVTRLAVDIESEFTAACIEMFADLCPQIRHLQLRVQDNSRRLIRMSEGMATFPRLARLALDIDFTTRISRAWWNDLAKLAHLFPCGLFPSLQACRIQLRVLNIALNEEHYSLMAEEATEHFDSFLAKPRAIITTWDKSGIKAGTSKDMDGGWEVMDRDTLRRQEHDPDNFSIGQRYEEPV